MSAVASPSLADLGDLSPGLRRLFARYRGTGMLSASAQEVQRLRRHLFEACRVDPADLALFDHFPSEERQAIARELHALVHARMRERQEEHARQVAAQAPVEALRRELLMPAERERLVDLAIWAHTVLGSAALAEGLVDAFFDLTTVERVRAFAAHQEAVIAAFRAAVRRRCAEREAQRRERRWERPAVTAGLGGAYALLGVPQGAPQAAVCQAYRALAKANHPDLGGDEARMKEINQAYGRIAATWR